MYENYMAYTIWVWCSSCLHGSSAYTVDGIKFFSTGRTIAALFPTNLLLCQISPTKSTQLLDLNDDI